MNIVFPYYTLFYEACFNTNFQMFRSGQYDYPVVLTSQDRRKKFKLPATNHCDAIVENLKRDAVILVQLTFDANEESNVLKSAVVSVKPLRVSLEG